MEITKEKEGVEEQLQSMSIEDVASCSSSILNSPKHEGQCDDEDVVSLTEEDDINVTILSKPANDTVPDEQPKGSSAGKKAKQLSGAGKKRFKRFLEDGHSRDEARRLAVLPVPNARWEPNKRPRENNSDGLNISGNNPRPVKVSRQAGEQSGFSQLRQPAQNRLNRLRSGHAGQSASPGTRTRPTYAGITSCVKVGILPKNYSSVELTAQQQVVIQKQSCLK